MLILRFKGTWNGKSDGVSKRNCVSCNARRGAKYFEYFKRNRAPHEGSLLPRPPGTISLLPLDPLLDYLEQEVWAFTTGQPSPTQALAGRPLGAKPTLQELLAEEGREEADVRMATGLQAEGGAARRKGTRPGTVIPPPGVLLGPGTHPPPALKGSLYPIDQAQVHVYWDVQAHHPGAMDPRVLAHRIRCFASCYGKVAGIYAYAGRKAFNWVPEAFLRQARYVGREGEPGGWPGEGGQAVQGSGKDDVGNGGNGQHHRCPVCGAIKRDAQDLQAHMRLLHPAAEAAARGGGTPGPKHSGPKPDGALTASSRVGDSGGSSGPVARNTSRRTLGRVLLYHNAAGQALVPPVGHQLSLKYSLMQEGVEARIVQNSAESPSSAVTNGMNRLLNRMRRGEVDTGVQTVIIAISDDEERIQKPLLRLRGMGGAATIAICGKDEHGSQAGSSGQAGQVPRYRGADCVASWRLLADGAYKAEPGTTRQ